MCEETLTRFGISDNAQVRIKQGNAETEMTARLDDGVPAGCIRVAAAHITTAMLGDMFGSISVERA
jgi:NADH-quinone oxidoreductase subunit G